MNFIRDEKLIVCGLITIWKQGRFINDIKSWNLDVIVATETRIKGIKELLLLLC